MGIQLSNLSEVFHFFAILLTTFILGALTTFILVSYLFYKYLQFSSSVEKKSSSTRFKNVEQDKLLFNNLSFNANQSAESARFVNVLLSFMFNEWRDTAQIQKWILKKINVELEELMEEKAARRLLRGVKVHDFNLGSAVPVLHSVVIKEPCSFKLGGVPDLVVIDIDLEYEGNFLIAVDVDLVFDKSAFLSVCVKELKGCIRLQFNRQPCTHWSVSFVEEPLLKVAVDTSFQSTPLPQLGSLITNQIQNTVKRKHTFPNFKLRYTPLNAFWNGDHVSSPLNDSSNGIVQFVKIDITLVSCTRLLLPTEKKGKSGKRRVVFATISLDAQSCEGLEPVNIIEEKSPPTQTNFNAKVSNKGNENANSMKSIDNGPANSSVNLKREANANTVLVDKVDLVPKNQAQIASPYSKQSKKILTPSKKLRGVSKIQTEIASACLKESEKILTPFKKLRGVPKVQTDTSYMMVTRNFSALLYEQTTAKPDGTGLTAVHVGAVTSTKSLYEKTSIAEGDRILSINSKEISSLGCAIAVIKEIRSQKNRFYFKVQRNRQSRSPSRNRKTNPSVADIEESTDVAESTDVNQTALPTTDIESDTETESDFSEIDSDEYESIAIGEQPNISSLGQELQSIFPQNPSNMRESLSDKRHGICISNHISSNYDTNIHASANTQSYTHAEDLKFAQIAADSPSKIFKTSLCTAEQPQYTWERETFTFAFQEGHKFLNVRFWYQELNTTVKHKKEKLSLAGNLSISLDHLSVYCNMMASRKFTRRYEVTSPLSPSNATRSDLNNSFKQRSGFRRDHCYGDVTITSKMHV